MKKLFYLIPFLLLFSFVSCSNNKNIANDDIDNTELILENYSGIYKVKK